MGVCLLNLARLFVAKCGRVVKNTSMELQRTTTDKTLASYLQRDVPVQQEQRQSRLFRVAPVAAHVVEKVARTFRGAVVLQPHLCRVRKMRVEEPREHAGGAGAWP